MQYESIRVLFNGDWSREERDVVEAATQAVEGEYPRLHHHRFLGKPWVCNRVRSGDTFYYLAQWSRLPTHVLRATSAAELAEKMIALAHEAHEL